MIQHWAWDQGIASGTPWQEPPTRVGVNAQEVSYLVRSTKRWNDDADG